MFRCLPNIERTRVLSPLAQSIILTLIAPLILCMQQKIHVDMSFKLS